MKKLVLIVIVLLSAAAARAQLPNVVVLGSGSFELNGSLKYDTVLIPLKLDKPEDYAKLKFRSSPYTVRLLNGSHKYFYNAITIGRDPVQPRLIVRVETSLLNVQGSYDVSVLYYETDTTKTMPFSFTLIRPATVLEAVAPVVVTMQGDDVTSDPLVLRETGGRAGISDLVLTGPYVPGINQGSLITFPDKSYSVGAGGMLRTGFTVHDTLFKQLPWGPTLGKMQISAAELTTPFQVQFTIMKKRSKGWIIAAVLAGLGIGFLVRHVLKDKKEIAEARVAAFQLERDIISEKNLVGDLQFKADVNTLLVRLINELKGMDLPTASAINAAVETARTGYNSRKVLLQQDLAANQKIYTQLGQVTGSDTLTDTVKARLAEARVLLQRAKGKLDDSDPTGASTLLADCSNSIGRELRSYAVYAKSLIDLLDQKTFLPAKASAHTLQGVQNLITGVQTALAQLNTDLADFGKAVPGMDDVQRQLEGIPLFLETAIPDDLKAGKPGMAADPGFAGAFQAWIDALRQLAVNGQNLNQVPAWDKALTDQLDAIWATLRTKLGAEDESAQAMAPRPLAAGRSRVIDLSYDFRDSAAALNMIGQSLAETRFNYYLYAAIQMLLLTLLIGLGVYNTYGPRFVGSWDELITIFLFSFSMDITVDNVFKPKAS